MRTILAVLVCAAALFAGENSGRRAPGFALPDSKMQIFDLTDYRGKIVAVLNSAADNQNTVAQYISRHGITYPVLFDAGQMAYSYLLKTHFDTPCVFLIDAGGTIKNDWEYSLITRDIFEGNGLMSEIDSLLSGKGAAQKARN